MNCGTQGTGGIARAVHSIGKLAMVLAVVLTSGGMTRAQDKPRRNLEIEAILKKLPDAYFRYNENGYYDFKWKDGNGQYREGGWFVSGSKPTENLPAKSTLILLTQDLPVNTDLKSIIDQLDRTCKIKAVSLGNNRKQVIGMPFVVRNISDFTNLSAFADGTFAKVAAAKESNPDPQMVRQKRLLQLKQDRQEALASVLYWKKQVAKWQVEPPQYREPGLTTTQMTLNIFERELASIDAEIRFLQQK